jgi:hypothetical protein
MPPRWLCGIIVGSWLATMGWLLWHDLLPRWLPGEPPPFHIDDVEEVQQKGSNRLRTFWNVERQDKNQAKPYLVFRASTWVDYHKEEDEYTLNASLEASKGPQSQPVYVAKFFLINLLTSAYRVNHSGQLRSLETKVRVQAAMEQNPLFKYLLERLGFTPSASSVKQIELQIQGEVHDQQFIAHCRVALDPAEEEQLAHSSYKPIQFDLPPVPVSYTGSVLMPLHPVSHIRGLRLGQSWRQPLIDPLRDALAFLPDFSGSVRWLNARVLPRPEVLDLDGKKTSCLVIEYSNEENERIGRTWVEQDGERVLQQEAILEDSRWIMKRELPRRSRNRLLDS